MTLFFTLITGQCLLGAFDNLWHHEIKERLPARRAASREVALHAVRELIYAGVLIAFAWWQWHGAWALLVAGALAAEVVVTLADFLVEDRTRRLPALERIVHTVLAINFGVALAVLAPTLMTWFQSPGQVMPVNYGVFSWLLSTCAVGALVWSIRNGIAVLRHTRPPEWVRNPITPAATQTGRNVLISGATGFIGGHLVRHLLARGDSVLVLTRDADTALNRFGPHVRIVTNLDDVSASTQIDAIVNLAGPRILGFPWTKRRRRKLIGSRVSTTRALVNLCARLERAPRVFVSASAIGYYGVRGDQRLDEQASPQDIFQSQLCQQWEEAAMAAEATCARVVRVRIGLVLGRDGGALPSLALPVRLGVGAVLGKGAHWVSWIHVDDLVQLIEFALEKASLRGPVNAVAPGQVTHLQMQRTLARTLHRPMWFRVPAWAVRAALGEMAQLLVDGQRVIPRRALATGFVFNYPDLRAALADLLPPRLPRADTLLTEMYYNGQCPPCRAEVNHYARLCADAQASLRFIDVTTHPDELAQSALRREHLERRIYLKDSKGHITSGLPAFIELWSRIPRYRWLARLLSAPGVRPVSNGLYDHLLAPGLALCARVHTARHAAAGAASR